MSKKSTVLVTLLSLFLLLAAVVGCGGNGKEQESDKSTKSDQKPISTEGKPYELNQPVSFGGATFTFTGAETMDSIPKMFNEGASTPDNGKYVVVYFTFKGKDSNDTGGVDMAVFRLKDSSGKEFAMDSDLVNYEASDLAQNKQLALPNMLMWQNPEEKSSVLVFDVDSAAEGFKLNMIQSTDGGVKTVATIDLGI